MKLHPIQNSFETGVVSPLLLGRSDTIPYNNGILDSINMRVDARGPMASRVGTRFGAEYVAECARLETFQVDVNVYFNMIFNNLNLNIGSLTGALPAVQLVTNPHFLQGSAGWSEITSGNQSNVIFGDGICTLIAQNGASRFAGIQQSVSSIDGMLLHEITIDVFPTATYAIRVGSAVGLGDYIDTTSVDGQFVATFTPGVVGPTDIWIEISVSNGSLLVLRNVSLPQTADDLDFVTPWDCDMLDDLYFVQAPGGQAIYILHRQVQPQKLTYDIPTNTFDLQPVTFTDPNLTDPLWIPPPEWGPVSWPGVGTIFQGRLWLMSTLNEPESMWGSRSGEYEKFFVSDIANIVADDAIMNVPMENYGQIQWAIGTKSLLVGTTNGEYVITSTDGLIRPSDIQIKRQSSYGSASVQPQQVNDQIVYVTADRRKLRAMYFADVADNWVSDDLLFMSEHLSEPGIKDFVWSHNPDNLLWCLLRDGTMLSCTYERNNNVIGWAPHDTQGSFLDISVGEILGDTWVNLLVARRTGFINYEVLPPSKINIPMDAFERKENATPTAVLTGLEHLEGMTVQILIEGAVHRDLVVVGGSITLDKPATDVFVGLGYAKRMVTLPIDKGAKTGSGMSMLKRWNKIYVRMLNSSKPKINGDRPPTRNPSTPMDTPELPRTEDAIVGNLGWDTTALITVEQDLPLQLTVVALFGELGQESL